ncbi:MAG: hypothetical protein IH948_10830 [Bacteroidetes bacterium]|nr:hypothetical protein [Bacteroidota bacterium]
MERDTAFGLLALFGVLILGIVFVISGGVQDSSEMSREQEVIGVSDSDAVFLASSSSDPICFTPCYETYGPGGLCIWCCFLKYFCEMDAGHSEGTSWIHLMQCLDQCLESTPVVPY